MLRNILLGVGIFAAVLSILIFSGKIPGLGNGDKKPQGEIMLWGTLPETQMNAIVQEFNPKAKTYQVRYRYIAENQFNQKLLEALASGTGPDMILAPYQIILSNADRITPFPSSSLSEKVFKDTYVDGSSVLFGQSGALGLPVSVEPMVLFYNRDILSKHGIPNPPAYWSDITTMAPMITIRDRAGSITEAAVPFGAPDVMYAKDIIMAIISQLGQAPVVRIPNQMGELYFEVLANQPVQGAESVPPLATALRYFTQFADPGQKAYSWKKDLPQAVDVFLSEKLAMYVGYSGEYQSLRARNPRASIEMTYLPQVQGYNTFSTGMKMHAVATLKASKNQYAALTVQSQFGGSGVAPAIANLTGGVPPFRSYASSQGIDPVIAKSMLVARGWYDAYPNETNTYTYSMIDDVINYRYGVSDAASIFVSRLRDLYTKK